MMKSSISLALGILFLAAACTHFSARNPSQSGGGEKPRHIVLTLHGVRGTAKSFGSFHPIIKKHLEAVDSKYVVVPINFTYKTGDKDYNPNSISPLINAEIMNQLGQHWTPEDKISVIGYSMGGQVMLHWYLNTLLSTDSNTQMIAERTKHLVGLGAPYWGSKQASFAVQKAQELQNSLKEMINKISSTTTEIESLKSTAKSLLQKSGVSGTLDEAQKDLLEVISSQIEMSANETRSLSITGNSSFELREKMLKWVTDQNLRNRFKPRILSIAGLYKCASIFQKNGNGVGCGTFTDIGETLNHFILNEAFGGMTRYETDMVVIVPSARMDFVYYKENQSASESSERSSKILASQFKDIESELKTRFIAVEALHAGTGKFLQDVVIQDVVIVDPSCEDPSKCEHLSYKHIFEEISDCPTDFNNNVESTCDKDMFSKYQSQLFKLSSTDQKSILTKRAEAENNERVILGQLHGFFIELNIHFPENQKLGTLINNGALSLNEKNILDYIQFNFERNSNKVNANSIFGFEIGRDQEKSSRILNIDTEKNILRVALMGRFSFSNPNQKTIDSDFVNGIWGFFKNQNGNYVQSEKPAVTIHLNFPGMPNMSSLTKEIKAVVKPTATTYIDINL